MSSLAQNAIAAFAPRASTCDTCEGVIVALATPTPGLRVAVERVIVSQCGTAHLPLPVEPHQQTIFYAVTDETDDEGRPVQAVHVMESQSWSPLVWRVGVKAPGQTSQVIWIHDRDLALSTARTLAEAIGAVEGPFIDSIAKGVSA